MTIIAESALLALTLLFSLTPLHVGTSTIYSKWLVNVVIPSSGSQCAAQCWLPTFNIIISSIVGGSLVPRPHPSRGGEVWSGHETK